MRLESARSLKEELTSRPAESGLAQSYAVLGAAGLEHRGNVLKTATVSASHVGPPRGVALGITPSRRVQGHKLAVRLQSPTPQAHQYAAYVAGKAADEVDVEFVGPISVGKPAGPSAYTDRIRPLKPGYSVGHYRITAGTIGGFVMDAKKRLGILSNNHVLANSNAAKKGDDIVQPGPYDGGKRPDDVIGPLERFVRLKSGSNAVDVAWALLDERFRDFDASYDGKRLASVLAQDDVASSEAVWKIGRTTGLTRGAVGAIELDNVAVDYDGTVYSFDGQIEVIGDDGAFSNGGDSGSFIIGAGNHPLGLLFAGSDKGGPKNTGRTYANVLEVALSLLGLSLAPGS